MKILLLFVLMGLSISTFSQTNDALWTVAWSPDDQYIAVGGEKGVLKIYDGIAFNLLMSFPIEEVIISRVKWHPYENKLAVITQSDSFKAKILDLDKKEWIDLEGLETSLRGLDWNYSGDFLAVSEFEGEISIFSANGKKVSRFLADPKSVTGIDWHPTKNILTAVGSQIGIFSYLGDTLNIFAPRAEEVLILCVEWHPTGDFFAIGDYGEAQNAENKLIQIWNTDAEKTVETPSADVEYRNIRWSPNGKKLASANDALRIWDMDGQLLYKSKPSEDYLWGLDWNSKGNKIITASYQGEIIVWDKKAKLVKRLN